MAHEGNASLLRRLADESEPAWEARLHFLRAGASRSITGTARALRKPRSLLTRWAKAFGWRALALEWDAETARQDESMLREAREASLERTVCRLEQILDLVVARLSRIARRDPATGEIAFDPKLTPSAAASILRAIFAILTAHTVRPSEPGETEDPDAELRRQTSDELRRLLAVIQDTTQKEEGNGESSPTTTS